jgi:hypothetical protein
MGRIKFRVVPERLHRDRRNADGVLAWFLLPILSILTLVLVYLMVVAAMEGMETVPEENAQLSRGLLARLKFTGLFRFLFAYTSLMFPTREPGLYPFLVRCKRCSENVPAPVETLPASWIAATCPLCGERRAYLPAEVFQGRISWKLLRKPVRTADGRTQG